MNAPITSISSHALTRFSDRVDPRLHRGLARVALTRMLACSYEVNDHMIRRLRLKPDGETKYYLSETSYGQYMMTVKRGVLVTLWKVQVYR